MNKTSFNEGWRCQGNAVRLPHDAMIHGERRSDAPSGSAQGYFIGGQYVYEKTFQKPSAAHAILEFEGVYRNARVFVNGKEAGGAAYGYIPFFVELDSFLVEGENEVRVTCEAALETDSRWYGGAGIYRPVWLWTGPKESIAPQGIRVHTISTDPPTVHVCVETQAKDVTIQILDGGKVLAEAPGAEADIVLHGAELWSADAPNLYTCRVSAAQDEAKAVFGIRTISASPKGLFVNGQEIKLRGGCIHHDSGILGAATHDEAEYRRVRTLKEAGFNAIRSSHNPASRAMLEACDRLGLYVMDEAWDMWFKPKSKGDYARQWQENWKSDLTAMVARDYNHPSVILYSIGNEVSEPATEKGLEAEKRMVELLHHLDASRPVTGGFNLMIIASAAKGKGVYKEDGGRDDSSDKKMSGMNSTLFNMITNIVGTGMNKAANSARADKATTPAMDLLDICGYNYASGRYPREGQAHPDRVIFGSETFPQDIWKNWQMVERYPYLVGDFMWTAWDYLGEAGIGAWAYTPDGKGFNKPYPWLLADTGAFDILGNPNGELYLAQAAWHLLKKPVIAVQPINHPGVKPAKAVWRGTNSLPSWSWKGCEGQKAIVEVYACADSAELKQNGRSLGTKPIKEGKAIFRVKYEPGILTAIANGQETSLISAKGDLRISVLPEKRQTRPGEILFVPICVTDGKGTIEMNADRRLSVTVTGGELLAFGSADPRTEERYDSGSFTTYYGHSLAVIRAGENGKITVQATDGKWTGEASITID